MLREKKKASAVKNFGEFSRRQLDGLVSAVTFPFILTDYRIFGTKIRNKGELFMNELLTYCGKFLKDWENQVNDHNKSQIEHEQEIFSGEILQDKVEDLRKYITDDGLTEYFRIQGLLEIILTALRNSHAADADSYDSFERQYWKAKDTLKGISND